MAKKIPLFACQECGKPFYSVAAAERASFGPDGCPKCGGGDIDVYFAGPRCETAADKRAAENVARFWE